MVNRLTVLSLGAGVQSTTILLMAIKGELPQPDVAIFADTGWESQQTYNHLEWLTEEARKCGIEVITVRKGNIREDILNAAELKTRFASMPFHCVYTGKPGMLRRECTSDYKIIPIHKKIRELLGYKPRQRIPKDAVEQWIGISTDESHRVFGFYDHTWLNNSFPLLAKGMTRSSCELWLHENYPGLEVAKSACLGCPFRCNAEWREVKANEGEWTEVIEFDNSIREMKGQVKSERIYLHRSLKPLEEVDLRTAEGKGQLSFQFYKEGRLKLFAKTSPLWLPRSEAER